MKLIVSPLVHVQNAIGTHRPSHILTLISPDAPAVVYDGLNTGCHLTLRFNDITAPQDGLTAPSPEMIHALLDFANTWDYRAPMLVHCLAGISRSTAAAYILACRAAGPGAESKIAARLRSASGSATPNALMVALADDILSREGRMVTAIAAIGRGEEAAHGSCFEFPV